MANQVSRLIGFIIAFTVGLFFRSIVWLHRRFPVAVASLWVGFIALLVGSNSSPWVGFVLVVGWAFVLWKFWHQIRHYLWKKSVRNSIVSFMESTLWAEHKGKRFVRLNWQTDNLLRATFRTPQGKSDADVLKLVPALKSSLELVECFDIPDDDPNDGVVSLLLAWKNPMADAPDGSQTPLLHMSNDELNDPLLWLPVGIDATGDYLELPLFLKDGGAVRALHAGSSGSGKSSIFRQQLAQAVLSPQIETMVLDGKGSEFSVYRPYVDTYGTTSADFWNQLRYLEEECKRRASLLDRSKIAGKPRFSNAWNHIDDGRYLVWFWDELATVRANFNPKQQMESNDRLYGVLSIARSLGIGVVFSSQTFKSDVLDTRIRDNCFDLMLGYKTTTLQESAYIGFAGDDLVRPDLIDGRMTKSGNWSSVGTFAIKGIGEPKFARSYFVNDQQMTARLKDSQFAKA